MGMSTHVVGFCPVDAEWEKYKKVWNSCKDAGIDPPVEVERFFGGENPNNKPGREIPIKEAVSDYARDGYDGFDVDIAKLPPNVKVVRFFNSY